VIWASIAEIAMSLSFAEIRLDIAFVPIAALAIQTKRIIGYTQRKQGTSNHMKPVLAALQMIVAIIFQKRARHVSTMIWRGTISASR